MDEKDTLVFNLGTDSEVLSSDAEEVKRIEAEEATRRVQRRRTGDAEKVKLRKLTDKERRDLERMMDHVAVHDYGENDEYNLTDSEKASRQAYYQEFAKLRNVKRKINKIDEYVRAVRQCIKCLMIVATNNQSYEIDEFINMVFNGEITVNGITIPTYIGKNKKTLNWDYVREYINDPNRDLKELLNTVNGVVDEIEVDDILPNPEIEARMSAVLSGKAPAGIEVLYESKKESKKMRHEMGDEIEDVIMTKLAKDAKNKKSKRITARGVSNYGGDTDDYEEIEKEDRKRGIWHDDDHPYVVGNISSIDDLDDRIADLDDYEYKHGSVLYRDKYQSPKDAEYAAFCDALDAGGFNVKAFMDTRSETERKLDKIYKKEDKEHKKLKRRIEQLNKRRELRKAGKALPPEEEKKLSKKEKKALMKKKKAEKALLNATGVDKEYDSMDDYSVDMSDFDF